MKKIIFLMVLLGVVGLFYKGKGKVAGIQVSDEKVIWGAILPHHELARELIEDTVKRIAEERDFSRIVVMSPNHFRPASYTFTTSSQLGEMPVDTIAVGRIIESDTNVVVDQVLVEKDHGLTVPMKYLSKAWPGAKFIPLLVSPYFAEENLRRWAEILASLDDVDTLYVASVDFSHEHLEQAAYLKDEESLKSISEFKYSKVFAFKDDHLDNPGGLATLMMIMEQKGALSWNKWYRSHGAAILGNPILNGTSYVTGVFEADKK